MAPRKSLDDSYNLIAALLHDVHNVHGLVFNTRSLRNTLKRVRRRLLFEDSGFLTKTLPHLGKAFDKALSGDTPLNSVVVGFKSLAGSQLPIFLGEFFSRVLKPDGSLLEHPCSNSVKVLRLVLYSFYKYELPYTVSQEQQVVSSFIQAEVDLKSYAPVLRQLNDDVRKSYQDSRDFRLTGDPVRVAREARRLLSDVFAYFDPLNIHPRHGPGAVATKQKLQAKYEWTNVSRKITEVYPFDAFFCASNGHVCDTWHTFGSVTDKSLPARVVLVPKDSRGPRLISCEPVDYQWIQQGLAAGIVQLVESHPLTKGHVNFTDQEPNRMAALDGSYTGETATLDLKEASDRVSLDLVRLLFPEHIVVYLEACRSEATVLPDGTELELQKFAPMGSCLCFPVMALTIWAILAAAAPNAETRKSLLVYGDDVIVPTTYVENAIEQLEYFGLKINRTKSCTKGLFRESCGMDAFQGDEVTPVRFRTVWSSTRSASVYSSWIAYANSFYDRQCFNVYDLIVAELVAIYGPIPGDDMGLTVPSLRETPHDRSKIRRRWNVSLQKLEYLVNDVSSPMITKETNGWSMLLRFFAEASTDCPMSSCIGPVKERPWLPLSAPSPFSVSQYTNRRSSLLKRRWR